MVKHLLARLLLMVNIWKERYVTVMVVHSRGFLEQEFVLAGHYSGLVEIASLVYLIHKANLQDRGQLNIMAKK